MIESGCLEHLYFKELLERLVLMLIRVAKRQNDFGLCFKVLSFYDDKRLHVAQEPDWFELVLEGHSGKYELR
jgi:hypothetical protein